MAMPSRGGQGLPQDRDGFAGALGQVAFGQGLQPPGDALDKPGAVAGLGGLAEQFGEALPQLADGQALERRDLVEDVQFHRGAPFWGSGNGQPVWTVSLISLENARPSEIKRRDFLSGKGVRRSPYWSWNPRQVRIRSGQRIPKELRECESSPGGRQSRGDLSPTTEKS